MSLPGVIFGRLEALSFSSDTEYLDTSVAGTVRVPHGDFLLSADFGRMGPHLSLSEGDTTVVVRNFFTLGTAPDLTTESGHSVIEGSLAVKLAGPFAPGQFAQLSQVAQSTGASSIGTVEKLSGTVTLTRTDGTSVQASKGTSIFSGDVIKTEADANIGIKFVDETSFSLGESGRMVIDEMIYDPSNNSNSSSSFSVVKGVFSFVSGQIAKSGDDAMVVKTPVASIGIRGTTVAGKAAAEGSSNSITLLPDADGGVGQIAVSNSAGTQIMSVPFQTTSLTSAFTAPAPPVIVPANQLENLYGSNITTVLPPAPAQQQQKQQQQDTGTGPTSEGTDGTSGEGEQQQEEGDGEGENSEGEGEPGEREEGEQEEGEGEEGDADAERPPGEAAPGDAPPGETAEGPPGEGDSPPPGEGEAIGEGPEQGPGEGPEGGPDSEPQQVAADQADEEQDNPNRYGNARDAFENARESGLSEEEAYEKAASAVGATDEEKAVAEAAFQQAIEEGADPREAVWRAEDAVREEFDRNRDPNRVEIEATSASIEGAIQRGASAEDALRQQLSGPDTSRENLDIAREAAYQSLDNVFRNDDAEGLAFIIDSTGGGETAGEDAFREALLEGRSIDEAFGAAFDANVAAAGGPGRDGRVDFLAADLFVQGFDPGLRASALIREVIDEIRVVSDLSDGTISTFSEIINATTGNDVLAGAPGDNINTQFFMAQGSTMGGNDTIDGGGGQDEIFMQNLTDVLLIADFTGGGVNSNMTFSTKDGSITGAAAVTSVEQLFFASGDVSQRLGVPGNGRGFAIAGTSGNDTIDLTQGGTSAADLIFGSLTIDLDDSSIFGSVIFGGDGNDTITSSGRDFGDIIFAGGGDDIIHSKVGDETIVAGDGDDTIIVSSPNGFFSADGTIGEDISGGANTSVGDTLQIGDASTSTGQTFLPSVNFGNSATVVGIENLHFFKSNTTLQLFEDNFVNFDKITAESGVSGISLIGASQQINLSTIDVTSAVTSLTAISSLGSGVRVFDANDAVGRTLIGTADDDTLSGFGGDDILQMGGGRDTLSGGDGNDTFEIAAASDVSSGIGVSGGNGTDTISLTSTSISSLILPKLNTSIATTETFDLSGGAAGGVTLDISGNELDRMTNFLGDGSADVINVSTNNFNAQGKTFNGIETITLTQVVGSNPDNLTGSSQEITFDGSTSISGLNNLTGTLSSSSVADDDLVLEGSVDLSGITFSNIDDIRLDDGSGTRQTIGANSSTSLGLTEIRDFTGGSGSTTDRFDYKSNLVSGNGTSVSAANDFTLTEINSGARATDVISSNATGVIDFETTVNTNNLGIDITSSTLSQITTAVEALLESTNSSTNLTGSSAQVAQGNANTDALLIFYDNNEDAVIIRYQEGSTSEADFNGELSVVAIFDNPGTVTTFENANII
jgi:hypothetical protein